jgi:hypothetical protein
MAALCGEMAQSPFFIPPMTALDNSVGRFIPGYPTGSALMLS